MAVDTKINKKNIKRFVSICEYNMRSDATVDQNFARVAQIAIAESVAFMAIDCKMNVSVLSEDMDIIATAKLKDMCKYMAIDLLDDDATPAETLSEMKKSLLEIVGVIEKREKCISK